MKWKSCMLNIDTKTDPLCKYMGHPWWRVKIRDSESKTVQVVFIESNEDENLNHLSFLNIWSVIVRSISLLMLILQLNQVWRLLAFGKLYSMLHNPPAVPRTRLKTKGEQFTTAQSPEHFKSMFKTHLVKRVDFCFSLVWSTIYFLLHTCFLLLTGCSSLLWLWMLKDGCG